MTEPTEKIQVSPYDQAMSCLAEHADELPGQAVAVLHDAAAHPALSDEAIAVLLACQAKGVAVAVAALAAGAARRAELERVLAASGSKARVLVCPLRLNGGRAMLCW